MKHIAILILCSFSMLSYSQVNRTNKFISDIEAGVNEVNSKARAQDIANALSELKKVNELIRFSNFDDWYRQAREDDGNYKFQLNVVLAPQLDVWFWRDMLQKVDRNKKLLQESVEGIKYDNILDDQDEAWVYLKTIYNTAKSIKDIVEKFGEKSFVGGFFSTKEGIDQFIEDYKKIEDAGLQKLNTAAKAQNLSLMISKAKKVERNYIEIEKKMGEGFGIVENFNTKTNELRTIAKNREKEVRFKIDWNDSRYSFDGSSYLQRVKTEGGMLSNGSIEWDYFKKVYKEVEAKALQNKEKVLSEIRKSDDENVKYAKIDEVNDYYEAYYKEVMVNYKSLETKFSNESSSEKLNLDYKIQGFEPVQYPNGRGSNAGSTGDQIRLSAVKAEADIQEFINLIHSEVAEVNKLANGSQMTNAIDRLNNLNRRIDKELGFYFTENYRKAREDNPNFKVQVKTQLSGQFKAAFWENSLKKNASLYNDLSSKYYETPKGNARRYWEITYSLCKSAYDMTQLIPDVEKELKESGAQSAWDKYNECIDGIKDDFKKIEKAFQMEYNTPENKADIAALMKKVKIAANLLESFASYMKANEEEAARFYTLIDRLNVIIREVESGPNKKINSFDDSRYNFDEYAFQLKLEALEIEFKEGEINWQEFDSKWKQLIRDAENQKDQVVANINASDDLNEKKKSAINTETRDWEGFYDYAVQQHDKFFELSKQFSKGNESNIADKQLFVGTKIDSKVSSEENSEKKQENIEKATIVGKVLNNGKGGGTYCSLDIKNLNDEDVLEFRILSGKLEYVQVIWRTSKGVWQTKYEGTRTKFTAGEFLKNITDDITHFNFVVNSNHNKFKDGSTPCVADVLLFPSKSVKEQLSDDISERKQETAEKSDTKKQYFEPKGLLGIMSADGKGKGKGSWLEIKNIRYEDGNYNVIKETKDSDILEINVISGELTNFRLVYLTDPSGISSEDIYVGKRTRFTLSELTKNLPETTTSILVTINTNRVSGSVPYIKGIAPCEAELWHLSANGKIPEENRIKAANALNKQNEKQQTPNQQTKSNNQAQEQQQMVAPLNREVAAEFNGLLQKADEAFNKPYWKENSGGKVTQQPTNPKKESLDLLRRAEQLINRQEHLESRYSMVLGLVSKSSSYALRVNVDKAKVEFINFAGALVSRYSNTISSVTKGFNGKTPAETRSVLYTTMAESWRELAKAAMWGNHQYNRVYCDKESKKYYETAYRENPKDYKLKKTLENINAPKSPVP